MKNGDCYTGEFVEGKRHGKGCLTYANGDKLDGSFFKGLAEGMCTMTYRTTGNIYEGNYLGGERHGEGVYIIKATGEKKKRVYENGTRID